MIILKTLHNSFERFNARFADDNVSLCNVDGYLISQFHGTKQKKRGSFLTDPYSILNYGSGSRSYLDIFVAMKKNLLSKKVVNH
jgi:hypothetical protein